MNAKRFWVGLILGVVVSLPNVSSAHEGRRLEVEVHNNQLWAQGSIGGPDDGGGVIRPYYNSMHDHWTNAFGDKQEATANLPAWDIINPNELVGHSVSITWTDAFKWVAPPMMPPAGTVPNFSPLASGELITVTGPLGDELDSLSLGQLMLVNSVDIHGHLNLDIEYKINKQPLNEIFILEWTLSSNAPGIADSRSIYTILSPDGADPMERLHHASLYVERYLGVSAVPEPGVLGLTLLAGSLGWLGSRRKR